MPLLIYSSNSSSSTIVKSAKSSSVSSSTKLSSSIASISFISSSSSNSSESDSVSSVASSSKSSIETFTLWFDFKSHVPSSNKINSFEVVSDSKKSAILSTYSCSDKSSSLQTSLNKSAVFLVTLF